MDAKTNNMNVLIVGANGWLGSRLVQHLNTVGGMSVRTVKASDVLNQCLSALEDKIIDVAVPDVIVNIAGYTGKPNVDTCLNNIPLLNSLNVFLPVKLAHLASVCSKTRLVHISSACIYANDSKFVTEDENPNFIGTGASLYSNSKYDAEELLMGHFGQLGRLTILRPRMIFDSEPHPKNLITKLLSYKKLVPGVKNSMTDLNLLLRAVEAAITNKDMSEDVYNVVNDGALSFEDLAQMADLVGLKPSRAFSFFESKDKFCSSVKEPRSFCTLSSKRLKSYIYVPELIKVMHQRMEQYKQQKRE